MTFEHCIELAEKQLGFKHHGNPKEPHGQSNPNGCPLCRLAESFEAIYVQGCMDGKRDTMRMGRHFISVRQVSREMMKRSKVDVLNIERERNAQEIGKMIYSNIPQELSPHGDCVEARLDVWVIPHKTIYEQP